MRRAINASVRCTSASLDRLSKKAPRLSQQLSSSGYTGLLAPGRANDRCCRLNPPQEPANSHMATRSALMGRDAPLGRRPLARAARQHRMAQFGHEPPDGQNIWASDIGPRPAPVRLPADAFGRGTRPHICTTSRARVNRLPSAEPRLAFTSRIRDISGTALRGAEHPDPGQFVTAASRNNAHPTAKSHRRVRECRPDKECQSGGR
ncbi:hypothetical protein BDI24065_02118 [Burkholderia diffusa]|uniref:Uncharacterized protein n=1 Tax=Burkholderia diffusa TaxID=488732 RepID=A0A6P2JR04_9BURK|nr:hypothetical protein BDI24065_02118 [Burkholderia diffusa]